MRPLLLPGLLDAARHNAARGRPGVRAVRVRARLPHERGARPAGARSPSAASCRRTSATTSAALLTQARPGRLALAGARADFFSLKARARGGARSRRRGLPGSSPAPARSCTRAARRRCWRARPSARWAGSASCTRWWRGAWDLEPAPRRSRSTCRSSPSCRPRRSRYETLIDLPRGDPGHRRGGRRGRDRARRGVRRARGGPASCSSASRCSTSIAASRWARATSRSRCGSSSARPTARSPTRRWPSPRAPIEARAARRSGAGCVPEPTRVAVLRRRPASRARWRAAIVQRHPALELTLVTARSDAGRRLDELYPRHRVPLELEAFDAERVAERADAAFVAYPHGAAAPAVEDAARARPEGGGPVGGLPTATRGLLRALVPAARGAGAARARPSTASPSCTATRSAAPTWWRRPGCYPTAAMLGAGAAARELMRDAVVDAKSGVSGAGREATRDARTSCRSDENVNAYKVEGHRHRAELEQELRRAAADHVHPAPRAARPGAARELLRDAAHER